MKDHEAEGPSDPVLAIWPDGGAGYIVDCSCYDLDCRLQNQADRDAYRPSSSGGRKKVTFKTTIHQVVAGGAPAQASGPASGTADAPPAAGTGAASSGFPGGNKTLEPKCFGT